MPLIQVEMTWCTVWNVTVYDQFSQPKPSVAHVPQEAADFWKGAYSVFLVVLTVFHHFRQNLYIL